MSDSSVDSGMSPDGGRADRAASTSSQTRRRGVFTRWAPLITAVVAAVTIVADQLSKLWAETALSTSRRVPVLGDLLGFQLVFNPGAAFSIGEQFTWVFAVVAGLAAIGVCLVAWRTRSLAWAVAWGLLLGGALTHLADRLFRAPGFARGHVVDFIAYGNWFIGNIADIAIVAAAVMLLLLSLLGIGMRAATPAGTSNLLEHFPCEHDND